MFYREVKDIHINEEYTNLELKSDWINEMLKELHDSIATIISNDMC